MRMLPSLSHLSDAELVALSEKMKRRQRDVCFDPNHPESRPCPTQLEIMKYKGEPTEVKKVVVRAANRIGKSQLGARIVSWWFQENHPYLKRPKEWGEAPILIMVIGESASNLETEVWEKKIRPFLEPGSFHCVRKGNVLESVEHIGEGPAKGNRIIFKSHHGNENVREKLQGFTANIVWLDEMPSTASILTELLMRLMTTKGYFYATFTPLVKNDKIRKMCDQTTNGWRTFVPMPDTNPMYKDNIPAYEAEIRSMSQSEEEYRSRRYGEWWYGSGRVVKAYHPDLHRRTLPDSYSPAWRHVVIIDPAASGTAGFCLVAEHPQTKKWMAVKAAYLDGDAPSTLVQSVETMLLGYNIIERRCDCNPASFYMEALKQGIVYVPHKEKNNRKSETIDKLNQAFLDDTLYIADTPNTEVLHDELMGCSWSETNSEKIVNESSYHTLDTLRYFADRIPPPTKEPIQFDHWTQKIKYDHEKAQQAASARTDAKKKNKSAFVVTRRNNVWR